MNSNTDWLHPSARLLVTIAAAIVVIAGLRAAQSFLIPLLIAAFLAIICSPAVGWLNSRKVPLIIAVIIVVLVLMSILMGVGAMIGSSIAELTAALPRYQTRVDQLWISIIDWLAEQGYEFDTADLRNAFDSSSILLTFGRGLSSIVSLASNSFLVFFLLVFMLFEAAYLPDKIKAAKGSLKTDLSAFSQVSIQIQRYLLLKTVISLITGAIVTIWVAVVGLDFPLVWGMIAFFLNFIPTIGSIIAAIPAIILALIQLGPVSALAVIIGFLFANILMANFVEPRVMGQSLGLSTRVVFVSLLFWGWVWGTTGMLLSIPLTMTIKIALESYQPTRGFAVLLSDEKSIENELEILEKKLPNKTDPERPTVKGVSES